MIRKIMKVLAITITLIASPTHAQLSQNFSGKISTLTPEAKKIINRTFTEAMEPHVGDLVFEISAEDLHWNKEFNITASYPMSFNCGNIFSLDREWGIDVNPQVSFSAFTEYDGYNQQSSAMVSVNCGIWFEGLGEVLTAKAECVDGDFNNMSYSVFAGDGLIQGLIKVCGF